MLRQTLDRETILFPKYIYLLPRRRWPELTGKIGPMKHLVYLLAASTVATAAAQVVADDALVQKYADEAVAGLVVQVERLEATDSAPQKQLDQARRQLFQARLLAARLRDDDDAQRALLQGQVKAQQVRLDRLQRQAKRGYAGLDDLRIARLELLLARQQLARHTADERELAAVVDSALAIETEHLAILQNQASRGYASSAAIATQKLRIAELIANQRITLPESGS